MRALSSAACTVHGSLQNLHVFFLGPRPAGLPATPPAPALLLRRAPQARPELGTAPWRVPSTSAVGQGAELGPECFLKYFFISLCLVLVGASLVAQTVKNLPAMRETRVLSLDQEDPPGDGHGNPLQHS